MMMLQVNGGLYGRYGKAVTNFNQTLPAIQSDLAQAAFKDPYHFGFLDVAGKKNELDFHLNTRTAFFT